MRVLFFMRSTVYARNFESTLRMLADRGHEVVVVADPHRTELIDRITRESRRLRYVPGLQAPFNRWSFLGAEIRRAIDYLRYLEPEYARAPKLRQRAHRKAPRLLKGLLQSPLARSSMGRAVLRRVLRQCDRAIPRDPAVDAFIRSHQPDLVLVTPLIEPGSPQSDIVRSARALKVPAGLCVYSWDNLTNKGLIHDTLDLITVWNRAMADEATTLHHVKRTAVRITGAAAYDHWFSWRPRESRDSFCARVGLAADTPYLLYLCSSKFIAHDELPFIRRWVTGIRDASPALRDVSVLVRPHPQNTEGWDNANLSDLARVAVWPPGGADPLDETSRATYFDSIHHSAAVVGINTSALIESAIVGRDVYTILDPEFRETQEGTLHFHHLLHVNGGLLHVAHTMSEHAAQLESALAHPPDEARRRNFLEGFIRPHGLDVAATPRLVEAIEAAATVRVRPAVSWSAPLLRLLLAPAATRVARSARARKHAAGTERKIEREAQRMARRVAHDAAKRGATSA